MREKFTITKDDEKYMNSIGKSLHAASKTKVKRIAQTNPLAEKGVKLHPIKSKVLHAKIGQGKSHISKKIYNHE